MAVMERRRTLTLTWDNLGDDDDDCFFESRDRLSTAVPMDLFPPPGSDDDDDEFEECRRSFASAISAASFRKTFHGLEEVPQPPNLLEDYDLWMADPGDIKERRKRLLQGMGLNSNKDLLKNGGASFVRTVTKKVDPVNDSEPMEVVKSLPSEETKQALAPSLSPSPSPSPAQHKDLVRARSDGDILFYSVDTKRRKEELIGPVSKQRITRTSSGMVTPSTGVIHLANTVHISSPIVIKNKPVIAKSGELASGGLASFILIKNLDTGKEFIVKEQNQEGMWNKFSDLETGKQLTMEEFEKTAGYSPVVKELMRRQVRNEDDARKVNANSYLSKSFRYSKKTGVALLKNIKGITNSMSGIKPEKEKEKEKEKDKEKDKEKEKEKERESTSPVVGAEQKPSSTSTSTTKNPSQWVKTRQQGKSYKEFTALHMSQEIQAHEGSIWTIKFSTDSHYLASAGEDRVIHVWEVQECDVMSARAHSDDTSSGGGTPVHPMATSLSPVHPLAGGAATDTTPPPIPEKKGKKKPKKKEKAIPDYVNVPETVFALSEKPVCTFKGHQDEVLALSWSTSQLLLSSSMDKTVRLWDIETKTCLKLFAHNDYVTCIQSNPVDDDYFISGSLDGKVRIWSIPDRQVIDWKDLREMVTACCYTPDSQGAIIGSHKGSCRRYTVTDSHLEMNDIFEVQNKKKAQAKKVTGFEFAPYNPAEVLVTSADSRIRIIEGTDIIHKFRGFRNTSSQISASFSPDGRYVISASEDSQVYIWRREEPKHQASGKAKTTISTPAHEHFICKDVSVAVPWPGSIKHEPPIVEIHSKKNSKRSLPPPYPTAMSPTRDNNLSPKSKRHLPPLSKKSSQIDRCSSCSDDEFGNSSRIDSDSARIDSGIGANGDSFNSAADPSSIRYGGDSSSISNSSSTRGGSQSWPSAWPFLDSHGNNNQVQASAWGLVIVAASSGGEIRVYQNFGLPVKASRPF